MRSCDASSSGRWRGRGSARGALLLGLRVEIQTNAHHVTPGFRDALTRVDLVGLSLDAASADAHDRFRSTRGNFARVLGLLEFLQGHDVQAIIRTVVTRSNVDDVLEIGERLLRYKNVCRWSLLEFSPIGLGYANRDRYELERHRFDELGRQVRERYGAQLDIDLYRLENKVGTYLLLTPDGQAYGTTEQTTGDFYPTVGAILDSHLSDIADAIAFRSEQHTRRYAPIETRLRER